MKALIDIGHPAHVHYFKNFIRIFEAEGNRVLVTARKKEMSQELLKLYNIPFISRGEGANGIVGKLKYLPKGNRILYRAAKKFRPDIFLSFSSPYAAQVSSVFGKPHLAFDDTEHAKLGRYMYRPFTELVLSPNSYNGKLSNNQQLFNGYMELLYLHPNYFKPRKNILDKLGIQQGEKYCILRFVSWDAHHDIGHQGISLEMKRRIVEEFSNTLKVYISSEAPLPADLEPYRFKISPDWMHDALHYSELFFGESATMASEAAVLGTPAIYLDDIGRGYTDDLEKEGLVFNYTESPSDQLAAMNKGLEIITLKNSKEYFKIAHQKMIRSKIDVTNYLLKQVKGLLE